MLDPITTVAGAYLSKDGLEKLLGPTAEYLGDGLRDFTKKRVETVGEIFQKAHKKLGGKIDEGGIVPPKVLKAVLDDGSFNTDSLAVEYLGGILASSRTEDGRDDRGARMAKLMEGLSTYQLRTHYLIYSTIRNLFQHSGLSLTMDGRAKMSVFIPMNAYIKAMEFSDLELNKLSSLLPHIFFGLHSENLIEGHFQYGEKDSISQVYSDAPEAGIVCQPSALGAELFLWAFGYSDKGLDHIFDLEFSASIEGLSEGIGGSAMTKK